MQVAGHFRVIALLTVTSFTGILSAQTAQQKTVANPLAALPSDRITAQINNSVLVTRPGNIHPLATAANDAGPVPDSMPMQHMTLVLQRDPAQQAALDALNTAQQDPASPLYHHWLTPAEFATHFGVSQNDINRITSWLTQMGFTVEDVPAAHMEIRFSGTAGQVEAAFHTAIHYYRTAEGIHYANSSDQKIPQAVAGVVLGVAALHDFKPKPAGASTTHQREQPEFGGSGGEFFMAPADFYTIYDVNPLYSSGTDGTGETIAVTAPCSVANDPNFLTVVSTFWSDYVNAKTSLSTTSTLNPQSCSPNAEGEVYLDVEWSGAVAKNAKILLVESDSIYDAASNIVNNNLAPIVTTSYGSCEQSNLLAGTVQWANLWQLAGTVGISSFVSSGDSGAAGCDNQTELQATQGLAVNAICSSQYAICVGGSEFNEGSSTSTYWNSTGAARGYIPEVAWNESGLISQALCPLGVTCEQLWSSGGGYSIYGSQNVAFARPSWQIGNSQSSRGVPDVSMSAAAHDGYVTCSVTSQCGPKSNSFQTSSGTSAATPVFAGIMALVVQKTGQRQGNPASKLYALASNASLNVFHDITSPGNNSVPGLLGFSAGPGWDPVTGLGSVDAANLVNNWPGVSGPSLSVSASQLSFGALIVGDSSSQSVTLKNTGNGAAVISSISIGGTNAGDFSNTNTCSSGSLSSGQSCTVTVTFLPTAAGTRAATLTINDSAPGSPHTVQLSGSGTAATGITYSGQQVGKVAVGGFCSPAPLGQSVFLASDTTVYLFFNLTPTAADHLSFSWVGPDGTTVSGGSVSLTAGTPTCVNASFTISNLSGSRLGLWQAEVLDNSAQLFAVPFTVGNIGITSNAPVSGVVPAAPGSLISLYLTHGMISSADSNLGPSGLPLPTTLNDVTVTINGTPASLLYVDGSQANQINVEVPPTIAPGVATVVVSSSGAGAGTGGVGGLTVNSVAPGLFQAGQFNNTPNNVTSSSPASAGDVIVLYGTGQGPIDGSQTAGTPSPGIECTDQSSVTINGQPAQVFFCGMSYFVGVTQINIGIPGGLPAGNLPVVLTINGVASNTITLPFSGH